MKLRFAFFFALFALATSAHAQSNCSTPVQSNLYNFWQTPPGAGKAWGFPDVDPCPTSPQTKGLVSYTVTAYQTASCRSTVDGSTYDSSVRAIYGYGIADCVGYPWSMSNDSMCDPKFYGYTTTATDASDRNRFYLQAFDDQAGINALLCSYGHTPDFQDYWSCAGLACPPPPPPPHCCPYNFLTGVCTPCTSPIILDTDGQGFTLTSAANGVIFDISGTGKPVRMAWTARF